MFKCGICSEQSKPKEKAFRVVVQHREKIYPARRAAHEWIVEGRTEVRDDPGGRGLEIAKEVLAHESCAKEFRESNL